MAIILMGQRGREVCQLVKERERGMMGSFSPVCRNDVRLKNTKAFVFAHDEILVCCLPCLKLQDITA